MQVRRSVDYRRVPWKNGGGETAEIAISPLGATIDTFDWRISMASVASNGPFSRFPGIDRTLAIIDGAGIALDIDTAPTHTLTPTSAPLPFSGDDEATARLIDGHVTDFNVMTRRGRFSHSLRRVDTTTNSTLTIARDVIVIFCLSGALTIELDLGADRLTARDTALRDDGDTSEWHVRAHGAAAWFEVRIVKE